MQTIKQLDETNSQRYRARARPKHALLRWEARTYELAWGNQHFEGPHMVILDDDQEYGSDLAAFFATHQAIPERRDHYLKVATVRARRVAEPTELVTVVRGQEEARSVVQAGGWIIQNPDGELYYNTAEEFARRYEPLGD